MRENRKKLKFKKITIANMNILRGGGETDTVAVHSDACPSGNPACPFPSSDIENPCSDGCIVHQTAVTEGTEVYLCKGYDYQP